MQAHHGRGSLALGAWSLQGERRSDRRTLGALEHRPDSRRRVAARTPHGGRSRSFGPQMAQGIWAINRGQEAIIRLNALAERLGYPVRITEEHEAPAITPARLVVVQRGETALAEQLRTIAGPSVPVVWDRRGPRPPGFRRFGARRPPSAGSPTCAALDVGRVAFPCRPCDRATSVSPPAWRDAAGRPRPKQVCWTCGSEVAPMRFRAADLPAHGLEPGQTLFVPDWCGCIAESTFPSPRREGGGTWCRSGTPRRESSI
jgi:hypothetical protein